MYALLTMPWVLGVTLHEVRLLMAEEEETRAEAGMGIMHDVSAGAFLNLGMEIQDLQCVYIQRGFINANIPYQTDRQYFLR